MNTEIQGEYWIINGHVNFADGDVGDQNHESIAIHHVFNEFHQNVLGLARELGIEVEDVEKHGELDMEAVSELLGAIYDSLEAKLNKEQIWPYVSKHAEINKDALNILRGGGDAVHYCMKYEGWIAVRSNNVELYGYNSAKQKIIANSIQEILYEEFGSEPNPSDVEIAIYDHFSKKSWYSTLEDLIKPTVTPRPQQQPKTTYNKPMYNLINPNDSEENKYSIKTKSSPNPWNVQAKKAGILKTGELWRGTSECTLYFKEWFMSGQ